MSIFAHDIMTERQQRADSALEDLGKRGVGFTQIEVPDNNGNLRGKITASAKALSPAGMGLSSLALAFRSRDQMVDTPFSNIHNGYPKIYAVPDMDTLVKWPWREDMSSVICDFYMESGLPCGLDGRYLLKKLVSECRSLGFEPRFGLEFELFIFRADEAAILEERFWDLRPWGASRDNYSLCRYPAHEFESFAKGFLSRMCGVGIEVEGFHTEYGDGMYEFAIAHESAVKAADSAARTKLHMKQYCHELGLVPTFMAAVHQDADNSMIGCHHNVSLWKDGRNAFWDSSTGALSAVGRHFAAGALQTMADYHLLFKPWPNSYRRMDPDKWCPVNVSWGLDNHSAAIRVVHGAQPEKHTRLEHRVSSTDINPYLTIAAILSGGLHGIRNEIEPPRYASKKIAGDVGMPLLQSSMQDSINAFARSDTVRESFGDSFVKHIVTVKTAEWEEYLRSCGDNQGTGAGRISRWELERYFLWV